MAFTKFGLQLIKYNPTGNLSYAIGVDNQAAIKALASESGLDKPGHYIAAEVLNMAGSLRKTKAWTKGKQYMLTIRWTAGHSNIPGSEAVDTEAEKTQRRQRKATPRMQ